MEAEVRCRYAKVEDREAVIGIIPDMHNGNDVLVSTYLDRIKDPAKLMFVGEHEGKVVAFVQYTMVDDGKTITAEGGRVVERFQHTGIISSLGMFAVRETLKRFPEARQIRWTSTDAEATKKAINSHSKIVAQRPAIISWVDAKQLKALVASEMFHQLYQKFDCDSSRVQTPQSALRVLQDSPLKNLFPDNLLFCQWIAYAPSPSNYQEITRKSVTVTTHHRRTQELLAVSFASENIAKSGRQVNVSIHTSCDPVPIHLIQNHIIRHLIIMGQYITSQALKTSVKFHLPKNTDANVISNFLVNELGLTMVDLHVRKVFYVVRHLNRM